MNGSFAQSAAVEARIPCRTAQGRNQSVTNERMKDLTPQTPESLVLLEGLLSPKRSLSTDWQIAFLESHPFACQQEDIPLRGFQIYALRSFCLKER